MELQALSSVPLERSSQMGSVSWCCFASQTCGCGAIRAKNEKGDDLGGVVHFHSKLRVKGCTCVVVEVVLDAGGRGTFF